MNLLCIADPLPAATFERLRRAFDTLPRGDGRATAGWAAREVKQNLQLDGGNAEVRALQQELQAQLHAHPLLRMYARPQRITLPLLSIYEPGMAYGRHVDDALMGDPPLRTDLAFTLFVSAPDECDGGELVVEGHGGDIPVKLDAGAMVVYPAGSLHRVQPVTRGSRLAAVGWIQSQVRDAQQREVLFDLDRTRRAVFEREGDGEEFATLSRCAGALLRMWAEP